MAQDFGELILKGPRLNQLDNVIVRYGISLLRWRSEVVKQPQDMPPSRFAPSTSEHSSPTQSHRQIKLLFDRVSTRTSAHHDMADALAPQLPQEQFEKRPVTQRSPAAWASTELQPQSRPHSANAR
jgi:hypothetical protein